MIQQVKEQIRVAVVFGPGNTIRPVWFDWGARKYQVREVTYFWQERQGSVELLHFAISDGANLFELTYNGASRVWALAASDNN